MNQNNITIRIARTPEDIEKALYVRWLGYRKYDSFAMPELEVLDHGRNCAILLAEDGAGKAIGTIRILDRRHGPIELEKFLNVDTLLPGSNLSIAETTRFSIPASPLSRRIKLLLWKGCLEFCLKCGIEYLLVSMRPCAVKDYDRLLFTRIENGGTYSHATLGNLPHESYYMHLPTVHDRYRKHNHPLTSFFFEEHYPNISVT